ncbi:MAG: alpha/beta hydrolase-fold protein [Candidatus Sumerlaeia bacterium]|nr:alpha/beta hydrolase-fold protein [Candidatus Sumerlaeia bacterium]
MSGVPLPPHDSTYHRLPFAEEAVLPGPTPVRFSAPRNVFAVEIQVYPPEGSGQRREYHPLECVRFGADRKVFQGEIPQHVVRERRWMDFVYRDPGGMVVQTVPSDGALPAPRAPIWVEDGQVFLYEPPRDFSRPERREFHVRPKNFKERRVQVLLPRCYRENRFKRYPVLIVQDGQNVFSPGSQFGSWDLDLTVMRLVSRAEIPEIIVFAIDNGPDRFLEYIPEYGVVHGHKGRAGEYLEMIRDELLPRFARKFRIRTDAPNVGHMGSSLGGLLGFHAANYYKETFGVVAALSPSFWVNFSANIRRARRPPDTRSRLWIDSGCSGPNSDGYHNTMRIRDALLEAGHVMGPDFVHVVGVGHEHKEYHWGKRSPDILRWMFPPKEAPPPTEPLSQDMIFIQNLEAGDEEAS